MKKFVLVLVLFFLSSLLINDTTDVKADSTLLEAPVCMTVNGFYIKSDVSGFLKNGYSFVSVRALSEALCADSVEWNERTSSATIIKGNTTITFKKDSKTVTLNGKNIKSEAAATIRSNRLFIPVRLAAEYLDASVNWNPSTYTVEIFADGIDVPSSVIGDRGYTDDDLYWLSRIINAESRGESMSGKIAVGNVVLNRVESPHFADNIYDVIFDTKYGVQFTPTSNGSIYGTPYGDSIIAAKYALSGENYIGECLYFLNPTIAENFWIVNNRIFYTTIGNHDFYL